MRPRWKSRPGVVLFDVILGTALLTIAGIGYVTLLAQNFATVDQLRHREREIEQAAEQLERMAAVWSASDFEARRGVFRLGGFAARITVVAPNLFDITIADTLHGVTLLTTTLYTPDTTHAGQ